MLYINCGATVMRVDSVKTVFVYYTAQTISGMRNSVLRII